MNKNQPPRLIVLNGTSSSGKSSIAHLLHKALLSPPRLLIKLDDLLYRLPLSEIDRSKYSELTRPCFNTLCGYTLSAIENGLSCIVDTVFEEGWFVEFHKNLQRFEPIYIKVFCPLEVAQKREVERGDRKIGTAKSQFDEVHKDIEYSIELDTSKLTPEESVSMILEFLQN